MTSSDGAAGEKGSHAANKNASPSGGISSAQPTQGFLGIVDGTKLFGGEAGAPQQHAAYQHNHSHHQAVLGSRSSSTGNGAGMSVLDIDPNSPAPLRTSSRRQHPNSTLQDASDHDHPRHLTVWDLISLGVGGTVGSGIFVLTGQIAHDYAGPATFVSWALAGVAALTSALSLCELASRLPHTTGSTYAYCRHCLHSPTAAVVAAACLTLEYAVSGAAVARTWGDKVVYWVTAATAGNDSDGSAWQAWLLPLNGWVNVPALWVSGASTLLLLLGVQESKRVANFFTALKLVLVAGMIVGGFWLFDAANFATPPFAPYGVGGVLRGATSSFFGYLGYDEVCVVAGEAVNARRDVPRAILGTLLIVTVCYVSASVALTGLQPYADISPTAGFPAAFASHEWHAAAQLTAAGELVTLPVVVLISLLAQPRLTYSMARDGILPPLFERRNADGNLIGGTLIWGVLMTATAAVVPFTYLDDLISCGILVAFCLANACLIMLRHEELPSQRNRRRSSRRRPTDSPLQYVLLGYNGACGFSAWLWSRTLNSGQYRTGHVVLACLATVAAICGYAWIATLLRKSASHHRQQQQQQQHNHRSKSYDIRYLYETVQCQSNNNNSTTVGSDSDSSSSEDEEDDVNDEPPEHFQTPCVPLLPCLGMAINWYLIAQLEVQGLVLLVLYLGGTVAVYRTVGRRRPGTASGQPPQRDPSASATILSLRSPNYEPVAQAQGGDDGQPAQPAAIGGQAYPVS